MIIGKLTEEQFKPEFEKKLGEFMDWGVAKGYAIGAYLEAHPTGLKPYIGYFPMKKIK